MYSSGVGQLIESNPLARLKSHIFTGTICIKNMTRLIEAQANRFILSCDVNFEYVLPLLTKENLNLKLYFFEIINMKPKITNTTDNKKFFFYLVIRRKDLHASFPEFGF